MDILHVILRLIVLAISFPFALAAALIPAYTIGRIVSVVGIPSEWAFYPVGAFVVLWFCAYFQYSITHPKE